MFSGCPRDKPLLQQDCRRSRALPRGRGYPYPHRYPCQRQVEGNGGGVKKKSFLNEEETLSQNSPWRTFFDTLQNPYELDSRPFNEALERERQEFAERQRRADNEDRRMYRNRPSYVNYFNQNINTYYTDYIRTSDYTTSEDDR
jgi:hypothetical protein